MFFNSSYFAKVAQGADLRLQYTFRSTILNKKKDFSVNVMIQMKPVI